MNALKNQRLEQGKILFGDKAGDLETFALWNIANGGSAVDLVLAECLKEKRMLSISRVVRVWLMESYIHDFFLLEICGYLYGEKKNLCTGPFFAGTVLALFETANQLDYQKKKGTPRSNFCDSFQKMLCEIILCENGREPWMGDPSPAELDQNLSSAIKKYARFGMEPDHGPGERGTRIAEVFQILDYVCTKVAKEGIRIDSGSVGEAVLEQLCYALFGTFSTYGKAKALANLHRELTKTTATTTV